MNKVLVLLLPLVLLAGCEREERHFEAERHNTGPNASAVRHAGWSRIPTRKPCFSSSRPTSAIPKLG